MTENIQASVEGQNINITSGVEDPAPKRAHRTSKRKASDIKDSIKFKSESQLQNADTHEDDDATETGLLDTMLCGVDEWMTSIRDKPKLPLDECRTLMAILIAQGAQLPIRDHLIACVRGVWPDLKIQSLQSMWTDTKKQVAADNKRDPSNLVEIALAGVVEKLRIPEPTPHAAPVDGNHLALAVRGELSRYVTAKDPDLDVIALWILMSYCHGEEHIWLQYSPRLAFVGPTENCGKTTSASVTAWMAYRGMTSASLTMATLFRLLDGLGLTVALDERDAGSHASEADGIINDGWSRGGCVLRMISGPDGEQVVTAYSVFAPVILAGIGKVGAAALSSRCIIIRLRPRTKEQDDIAEDIDWSVALRLKDTYPTLISRWALDSVDALNKAPRLPAGLASNRDRANWQVLFRIAYVIGGEWPVRLQVALDIATERAARTDADSNNRTLITDIVRVAVHQGQRHQKLWHEMQFTSFALAWALRSLPDSRWTGEGDDAKKLTPKRLSLALRSFDVRPDRIDHPDRLIEIADPTSNQDILDYRKEASQKERRRGYDLSQFKDLRLQFANENIIQQDVGPEGRIEF